MPVPQISPRRIERIYSDNPWADPRSYAGAADDDRPDLHEQLARSVGHGGERTPYARRRVYAEPAMPLWQFAVMAAIVALIGAMLATGGIL